jgi:hypothetical protein
MSHVVLITGCSTVIGRDHADQLSKAGCIVVATARKVGTIADLPIVLKLPQDRQYQQVSDSMRKQEPGPEVVTKAVRKAPGDDKTESSLSGWRILTNHARPLYKRPCLGSSCKATV